MIGLLVRLALSLGIPARFARLGGIVIAVAVLVILIGAAKCGYDATIIDRHDAGLRADTAESARAADGNSADARLSDLTRLGTESAELSKAIDHAPPLPAHTGLSPARRAYYDCLRRQQEARTRRDPPPKCG